MMTLLLPLLHLLLCPARWCAPSRAAWQPSQWQSRWRDRWGQHWADWWGMACALTAPRTR
jgi:hypothetical protein